MSGLMYGYCSEVFATPTVSAQTYAQWKSLGGLIKLASVLPKSESAVLQSITLKFSTSIQSVSFSVSIFRTSVLTGTYTDTSSVAITAADYAALLGTYRLSTGNTDIGAGAQGTI